MKRIKSYLLMSFCLVAMALSLTGCGGDDETTKDGSTGTEQNSTNNNDTSNNGTNNNGTSNTSNDKDGLMNDIDNAVDNVGDGIENGVDEIIDGGSNTSGHNASTTENSGNNARN